MHNKTTSPHGEQRKPQRDTNLIKNRTQLRKRTKKQTSIMQRAASVSPSEAE